MFERQQPRDDDAHATNQAAGGAGVPCSQPFDRRRDVRLSRPAPTGIMDAEGYIATLELPMDPRMSQPPAKPYVPPLSLELQMSGYQNGDEQAATALFENLSPLLLRYFLAYSAHRRYSEDLAQETWIRIHRARHTYRTGEPLLPWVFAIARHTALDHYRKARRVEVRERQVEVLPEIAAYDASLGLAEADGSPDLDAVLAHLPPSQREVLVMLKVTGMTIDEVARATASSAGSVKQKAHRAYRKLREILGQRERSR